MRRPRDLARVAERHASARDWYGRHTELVHSVFAFPEEFQRLLAATSPRMTIKRNALAAIDAYYNLPDEPERGLYPPRRYMATHLPNIERARRGEPLSGPKVSAFAENLLGNLQPVVIDVHMARLLGMLQPHGGVRITDLRKAQRIIERTAALLGWQPAECQAALWSYQVGEVKRPTDYLQALQELYPNAQSNHA